MKKFKSLLLLILVVFTTVDIFSQANPSAGILPLNPGGIVALGAVQDIEVSITNTLSGNIVASKLRPNITVPSIVTILPDAEQTAIPAGWVIVSNTGDGTIRICNGSDVIGGGQTRNIIIKVRGTTIGISNLLQIQINFGGATCAVSGPQPSGNVGADDFASATIEVIASTLPLTLLSFNAALLNCQPTLNWITENEINSDRFEIERGKTNNSGWVPIGIVAAKGNTSSRSAYKLIDNSLPVSSGNILYRLKMIDKDGSFKYSDILRVIANCKTTQLQVYPNPVQKGRLYVSITGANGFTEATLLTLSGQVLLNSTMNNGTNYIDVSNFADGVYVLNIKDGNGFDKKVKVLIQQ